MGEGFEMTMETTRHEDRIEDDIPPLIRDRRLLKRFVRENSDEAFHELIRRHLRLVYATCLRELGDPGLAEDATQIVFLILARKAPSLTLSQSLAGWLFVTARFTAVDIRRREQRRRKHETELETADVRGMAYEDFAWRFIDPNLNEALATLGTVDREAVLLRFFEQLQFKEIGERLALSEPAAERRVARALVKLRRHMAKAGFTVSLSALGALLYERTAQAVPANLPSALKTAAVSHAASAALLTQSVSIAERIAESVRFARLKLAGAAAGGALVIVAIHTMIGHRVQPHPASTAPVTIASSTLSTLSTVDTPVDKPAVKAPSRVIRKHHATARTKESPVLEVDNGSALESSTPHLAVPTSTSAPSPSTTAPAKQDSPAMVEPPRAPVATDTAEPRMVYTVVAVPDDDPRSLAYAIRRSSYADLSDADRPAGINNNGEIVYRCGDVYRWDGASLTFERRTYGLSHRLPHYHDPRPKSALEAAYDQVRRRGGRIIVQSGGSRREIDVPPPVDDESSTGDEQETPLVPETGLAASIDDGGDVLGISASGVFVSPADGASYAVLANPYPSTSIAGYDFHGRLLNSGRIACNLAAVPSDYRELGGSTDGREVSFMVDDNQVSSLASLLDDGASGFSQAGIGGEPSIDGARFCFADVNESGLAVGTLLEPGHSKPSPVYWSGGRVFTLPAVDGLSNARLSPAGINSNGDIVGMAGMGSVGSGILWKNGVGFDLNSLTPGSTWHITRAFAINDSGLILAWGRHGDAGCALLLTPRSTRTAEPQTAKAAGPDGPF